MKFSNLILTAFCFALCQSTLYAEPSEVPIDGISGLKRHDHEHNRVHVWYNPNIAKPIDDDGSRYNDGNLRVILETSLEVGNDDKYWVVHTRSNDLSMFLLVRAGVNLTEFRSEGREWPLGFIQFGSRLLIPGNGAIYLKDTMEHTFKSTRIFVLEDGILKERLQPMLHVGKETMLLRDITIYGKSEPNGEGKRQLSKPLVKLIEGTKVELLLCEYPDGNTSRPHFLVKAPSGIVGWYTADDMSGVFDTVFEDIFGARP